MISFNIEKPNIDLKADIITKINNLNKPKSSLGILEDIAEQICLIQQTLSPTLKNPCHLLFGGDHGIENEGVSASPREVTWQQMINFTKGGGGVNMFCRQHNFKLFLIDVGVDYDLSNYDLIINKKIANGTNNFLYTPAMSKEQLNQAFIVGRDIVNGCAESGCNVICLGEMGIANTSASSMLMHFLGDIPLDKCVGSGSGINEKQLKHKYETLQKAAENFKNTNPNPTIYDIIAYFSGFEMAAAIGAMLQACEKKMVVLVDGFIMSACFLAAKKLYPAVEQYAIFGHCGDESGHKLLLSLMNARPILNLRLRLGEGTGALCAYPIIESAVRMVNEMNNFQNAKITKYF